MITEVGSRERKMSSVNDGRRRSTRLRSYALTVCRASHSACYLNIHCIYSLIVYVRSYDLYFMLIIFLFFVLILSYFFLFFFFSSRRRHTRLVSDWSSDVCSSD